MPTPLPLPVEAQAGAETVTRALRQAEVDPHIAAVILHVESPGGSSLASDLIWREVRRLQERKPVVVLMGEQAASGGYYVSAAANHIIARPTTMTGSIGIWGGKFVVGKLYDRLKLGHEEMKRGAMAGFYSELKPFSDEEREQMRQELGVLRLGFTAGEIESGFAAVGLEDPRIEVQAPASRTADLPETFIASAERPSQ